MPTATEDEIKNQTESELELSHPRKRTKLSSKETITGNKYDIILACQPDSRDHYPLYREIVDLVGREGLRIYSPHEDFIRGHVIEEVVKFTTQEAIPRTRGVLVHLTTITPEIKKMFQATHKNNRPFMIFYSSDITPFNETAGNEIRAHPYFRGEHVYIDEKDAINFLEDQIQDLIRAY